MCREFWIFDFSVNTDRWNILQVSEIELYWKDLFYVILVKISYIGHPNKNDMSLKRNYSNIENVRNSNSCHLARYRLLYHFVGIQIFYGSYHSVTVNFVKIVVHINVLLIWLFDESLKVFLLAYGSHIQPSFT